MEAKEIVNIGLEHIHPHPDNPRKDLGDLTELAESIKKNPKGTIIEFVDPLEDPYAPKPVGSRFRVYCVDDALQLQGHWLPPQSGSIAVIIEKDKFKIMS